jgi:hypothetical protein
VSPQHIAALLWRHVVAVAVIFTLAGGLAYHFKHATPGYAETATVEFTAPGNGVATFSGQTGVLVMDELVANSAMSPAGQEQVTHAGGGADYDVALVNLNNEDFPNYSNPYVTVTTTSPSAAEVQKTFLAVMQVLNRDLMTLQLRQGAQPGFLMGLRTIGAPSGPIAQTGSPKRVVVGLAILTLIAAFMTARLLDRRPVRLRAVLGKRNKTDTADRSWRAASTHQSRYHSAT